MNEQPPHPISHKLVHRCPPWFVPFIDNPLRRRIHDPHKLFAPYVKPGMTALDLGVGFGFTTIGLAEMVGPEGRVIAVDAQEGMLVKVRERAEAKGVLDRIDIRCSTVEDLTIDESVDFANACFMIHEVDDQAQLFKTVHACLKPSGHFFIAEPLGHVSKSAFEKELALAASIGLRAVSRPHVMLSRAAVLKPA